MNINDIAKLAGVSTATVSRVLNNIKVRPKHKEMVEKVLKETGYKPNRTAQGLASKKSKLIGMILPSIMANVYSHIVDGVNSILQNRGYSLILTTTHEVGEHSESREIEALNFLKERSVDGVIYIPQTTSVRMIEYLKNYDRPIVSFGEKMKGTSVPALTLDDYNAAKSMVQYLIDLGHRDIAFVGIPDNFHATGFLRKKGYIDALTENGIEVDEERIVEAGFTLAEGYSAAREVVKRSDKIPTAVFTALDRIAFSTVSYLQKAGYRVPEDVSVVGIDDDDISSYYSPPLTTIHYDFAGAGEIIANMLLDFIEKEGDIEDREMKFSIKERGSAI